MSNPIFKYAKLDSPFRHSVLAYWAAINGERKKNTAFANESSSYAKEIITYSVVIALFSIVKTDMFVSKTYLQEKGFLVGDDVITGVISLFTIPFILSFTPWSNYYPKDIACAKELFGYPVALLPNNKKQYVLFTGSVIVGVIFEEFVCRLCMFYFFYQTFHLTGDMLVLLTSLLFAVGHLYQGWKGIAGAFVVGLLLGKIFLLKGTLAYPIALHLLLNLTIVVLAYRRIKDLQNKNIRV